MEGLNFVKGIRPHFSFNGRKPQLFQIEDNIKYCSEEKTAPFFQMEDDPNILVNGRRPE